MFERDLGAVGPLFDNSGTGVGGLEIEGRLLGGIRGDDVSSAGEEQRERNIGCGSSSVDRLDVAPSICVGAGCVGGEAFVGDETTTED